MLLNPSGDINDIYALDVNNTRKAKVNIGYCHIEVENGCDQRPGCNQQSWTIKINLFIVSRAVLTPRALLSHRTIKSFSLSIVPNFVLLKR